MSCCTNITSLDTGGFDCGNLAGCSIGALSDVDLTGIAPNNTLAWNGSTFIPATCGNGIFDVSNEGGTTAITNYSLGSNLQVMQGTFDYTHQLTSGEWEVDYSDTIVAGARTTVIDMDLLVQPSSTSVAMRVDYSDTGAGSTNTAGTSEVLVDNVQARIGLVATVPAAATNEMIFTSASVALNLTGDFRINGDPGASGEQFTSSGAGAAPVWGPAASDIALKEDVSPLEYGLDEILRLLPKKFRFKGESATRIGFIAQEARQVTPELVVERTDGNLGLRYQEMIPVLVNALKELVAKVDRLTAGEK